MSSFYENNQKKNIRPSQYPPPSKQYYPGQFYPDSAQPKSSHNPFPAPPGRPKPRRIPPMPKVQALELAEKLKRGIIVVALLGFGMLSALVIGNMPTTASTSTNQATPTQTDPSSSGGVLQQQQGGYGFGATPTPQGPVSRSHSS
jgi:hypothetical protein